MIGSIMFRSDSVDNIEELFPPGYVHLVIGQPQMGKTALLLTLMYSFGVIEHIPTIYFSLEESKVQLVRRLISFGHGKMCNSQEDISQEVLDEFRNFSIYLDDTANISIDELCAKVNRMIENGQNLKFILIDNLNWIKYEGASRIKYLELAISMLAHLADEFGVSVICTYQLSPQRSKKYYDDGVVDLSSFEDSISKIAVGQNILQYVIDRPNYFYTNYIDNGYSTDNSKGVVNLHSIVPYGNIHSFKFNYELAMLENLNKHQ